MIKKQVSCILSLLVIMYTPLPLKSMHPEAIRRSTSAEEDFNRCLTASTACSLGLGFACIPLDSAVASCYCFSGLLLGSVRLYEYLQESNSQKQRMRQSTLTAANKDQESNIRQQQLLQSKYTAMSKDHVFFANVHKNICYSATVPNEESSSWFTRYRKAIIPLAQDLKITSEEILQSINNPILQKKGITQSITQLTIKAVISHIKREKQCNSKYYNDIFPLTDSAISPYDHIVISALTLALLNKVTDHLDTIKQINSEIEKEAITLIKSLSEIQAQTVNAFLMNYNKMESWLTTCLRHTQSLPLFNPEILNAIKTLKVD